MADFIPLGSKSYVPKSRRAKHQNFQLQKSGKFLVLIGSISYELYELDEITQEVLDLRDARRLKQGMKKAEY